MTEPDLAERLAEQVASVCRHMLIDDGRRHERQAQLEEILMHAIREALREAAGIATDEAARRGALETAKRGTVVAVEHRGARIASVEIRDRILRLAGEGDHG